MNILLCGLRGFMGREVLALSDSGYRGASVALGVDPMADGREAVPTYKSFNEIPASAEVDCIVDFSHHSAIGSILEYAKEHRIPVVVATTGHTENEISEIKSAADYIPVFHSGNMSLGIALLCELAKTTAQAMPEAEIEIIEKHHNRKLDAPSGTALMLAESVREVRPEAYANLGRSGHGKRTHEEIGIHSIRMGNIVGEHEVIIGTPNQTITLKHEAHNRALFAEGALCAAEFLVKCPKGLYDMKSIVSGDAAEDRTVSALGE